MKDPRFDMDRPIYTVSLGQQISLRTLQKLDDQSPVLVPRIFSKVNLHIQKLDQIQNILFIVRLAS